MKSRPYDEENTVVITNPEADSKELDTDNEHTYTGTVDKREAVSELAKPVIKQYEDMRRIQCPQVVSQGIAASNYAMECELLLNRAGAQGLFTSVLEF